MIQDLNSSTSPLNTLEKIKQNPSSFFPNITEVVFHGTPKNITDSLEIGYSQDSLLYASDDPLYAAFLGIIKLEDEGRAGVAYDEADKISLSINQAFMDGESELVTGTVFILDKADFFKSEGDHEFISKKKVTPLGKITIEPEWLKKQIEIK